MASKKGVKKAKKKAKKKAAPRTKAKVKVKAKKASARPKLAVKKAAAKKPVRKRARGRADSGELVDYQRKGLGAISGGQSGDTQGISARVGADSESVAELLEEGQTLEAEAVAGVENAPDPDQGEVRTHQFPEVDVPEEYRETE
jgi:hypothetical protein